MLPRNSSAKSSCCDLRIKPEEPQQRPERMSKNPTCIIDPAEWSNTLEVEHLEGRNNVNERFDRDMCTVE